MVRIDRAIQPRIGPFRYFKLIVGFVVQYAYHNHWKISQEIKQWFGVPEAIFVTFQIKCFYYVFMHNWRLKSPHFPTRRIFHCAQHYTKRNSVPERTPFGFVGKFVGASGEMSRVSTCRGGDCTGNVNFRYHLFAMRHHKVFDQSATAETSTSRSPDWNYLEKKFVRMPLMTLHITSLPTTKHHGVRCMFCCNSNIFVCAADIKIAEIVWIL